MNGTFAPPDSPDSRLHRRQLATAANAALRGETHNAGRFTAEPGDSYILRSAHIGVGREIMLIPRNEAAASARWYIANQENGRAFISFSPALTEPAEFGFVVAGVGNTK